MLKLGVVYPIHHLNGRHAQHRLALSVRGKRDPKDRRVPSFDAELAPLFNEIRASSADTAIISSEAFFATDETHIRKLHDALNDFDPIIVFYARRQDDTYISSFTQRSKSPTNNYALPIHTHLNDPINMSRDLDIYKHASNWSKVFGIENVAARLYYNNINISEDFLRYVDDHRGKGDILSAAISKFITTNVLNKSPKLEATEIMRLFKQKCADVEKRRNALALLQIYFSDGRPASSMLSTADRRSILEFFRSSNEKLFRDFFASENKFAPEVLLSLTETKRETLTLSETAEIAVNLLNLRLADENASIQEILRRLANKVGRLF